MDFARSFLGAVIVFTLAAVPLSTSRPLAREDRSNTESFTLRQDCAIADTEFWANRPIDNSSCGVEGDGDEAHQAQNRAKNQMCAGDFLTSSPGTPARVTQFTFRRLQEAASDLRTELGLGIRAVPPDRSPFKTMSTPRFGDALGEGKSVRRRLRLAGAVVETDLRQTRLEDEDERGSRRWHVRLQDAGRRVGKSKSCVPV